ncbi:MAG: hypothetical protein KGJ79_10750 [Alphaproteobacteria bacterium]|nr:hypothetical protein [Alphaproteobacteria bacterium]MDE2111610.1 hypothetical protein [Alphaproteobacteria bacterium]MDE2494343.1 hypothetical protein [Alphaproteobacteria bacterium]
MDFRTSQNRGAQLAIALIKAANPFRLVELAADTNFVRANRDKIVACQNAATKAKKEERCIITVQAPYL